MMSRSLKAAILAASLVLPGAAQAAVVYAFTEVGADVIGTLSGTLDTTGLTAGAGTKSGAGLNPQSGVLASGADGAATFLVVSSAPGGFGTGSLRVADQTSGDLFVLGFSNALFLPGSWVSGSSLSGSMTFLNTDLAGLGVIPGSHVWTLPNDTITVSFQTAAIPLPPALPALGAGLLGLGWLARRRRG